MISDIGRAVPNAGLWGHNGTTPRGSLALDLDPYGPFPSAWSRGVVMLLTQHRLLRFTRRDVKTHLVHIYNKLAVSDRAAAVARAYERGVLTT